jgi:hypothetical protein
MLKDEDVRVLPFVLEALRKSRGNDSAETLRQHLMHPDGVVRAAAAEGLGALGTPGVTPALVAAYRASLGDRDLDPRTAVVGALAAQKGSDAASALEEIAKADPSRAVRSEAAAALRGLGRAAPPLGAEPVERPFADYREAMRPYDPIPGAALYSPRAILHTRYGPVEVLLNTVEAPFTVASFMDLARRAYDGLSFHRVVPGFVTQLPRATPSGRCAARRAGPEALRARGRGGAPGKGHLGSQFFVTHAPAPHLVGPRALLAADAGWRREDPPAIIER